MENAFPCERTSLCAVFANHMFSNKLLNLTEETLSNKRKHSGLTFNPGLVLTDFRTAGPRRFSSFTVQNSPFLYYVAHFGLSDSSEQ